MFFKKWRQRRKEKYALSDKQIEEIRKTLNNQTIHLDYDTEGIQKAMYDFGVSFTEVNKHLQEGIKNFEKNIN